MSPAPPEKPDSLPPDTLAYAQALFDAARRGNIEALRQPLAAGLPPNMQNQNGDTMLMLASYKGHADLVTLLLSHGADPNRLNDRGQSPLAGAIFKGELAVVDALLEGGADPDVGQPTPWDTAKMFNRLEELQSRMERNRRGATRE